MATQPTQSVQPAPAGPPELSPAEQAQWQRDGFFIRRRFAGPSTTERMLREVVDLARSAGGLLHEGSVIFPEANLREQAAGAPHAEDRLAKIFRIHRKGVFCEFVCSEPVLRIVRALLGDAVDCFLSQFIFKNPGAWGQPWHQDSYYFPFDRGPQVGLWLAVTEATLENGVLHVLPGSQVEPVHTHVRDRRPDANYGYVEIVDHDMEKSVPVLMDPGDLLVFHSHLMHRSTDNVSSGRRAAMVYHFAQSGTRDLNPSPSGVIDWMPLPRPAGSGGDDA
jgi:phytanoyl-CoA hydroxylase